MSLSDGVQIRQVGAGAPPDGGIVDRRLAALRMDPGELELLRDAMAGPARILTVDDPARLVALGAPAEAVAGHPSAPVSVATVPIAAHAAPGGVLAVAGAESQSLGELEELVRRGATAISAAFVYEERATLAGTLRAALVPPPLPAIPGVDVGASYRPAQETTQIGGDFYEVVPGRDGGWTLSIGDVCGKGVDAAVLTGQVRQSLRTASLVSADPARTLALVNEAMLAAGGDNFVTIVHGLLRIDGDVVRRRLAAGGHPPPLLLRDGRVEPVAVKGTIVGILPEAGFRSVELDLRAGDALLLYTDGAPEARRGRRLLGLDALAAVLADSAGLTAQAITERIMQRVLEHLDGRPHDDIALVAVRPDPARPA